MDFVLLSVYLFSTCEIGMFGNPNHAPALELHITTSEKILGQYSGK